ncbi:MAG: ZIP family metal transporter [Ruminococcaceae bacterium]|nr:ZIP family metal transporter [Oscillospiraceae bacterium]
MQIVLLTAIGVGAATVIGAIIGFIFKKISHAFSDIVMSFAAGIMLAAAIVGLILPSLEYGGKFSIVVTIAGIFAGAACVSVLDKLVPHMHNIIETEDQKSDAFHKVMLFVTAIAMHNLPEGIAAGVGFGTEDVGKAIVIAGGIALQNIPEGMIIIAPMLSAGISLKKSLLYAMFTGAFEVLGTFIGYFATGISRAVLPFALAFAGGTMLYIISDEMIPETHAHGHERGATYALLIGFCVMLIMDFVI